MTKILAFDIGTNSLGTVIRNPEKGRDLKNQIEYFSSDIFDSGVGTDKSGEYSYAAERSRHRRSRRLFEVRRRRNWSTLKLLIEHKCCPLSMEELIQWSTYDKTRGMYRRYPLENKDFQQWIALDFNSDGRPDYTSPYQLRMELANKQFDFTDQMNRFKLGRALYHISQRRGFKSSKGETLKEQQESSSELDLAEELKKSEQNKSRDLAIYMEEHSLHTVGEAFASLERNGDRVRGSDYQAIRSQYKDEIAYIFDFQRELTKDSIFYHGLVSEKKGEGTIFYKNPLRSQKGLIGKCTLEPKKTRCPESHPAYEEFRAWCFINNIRYKLDASGQWLELPLSIKNRLYEKLFLGRLRDYFQFQDIRNFLEKEFDSTFIYSDKVKTINYKDNQSVSGCPISARLKKMMGDDWKTGTITGYKTRLSHSKHPIAHVTNYSAIDLWNICFNAEEADDVVHVAKTNLRWSSEQTKQLVNLWSSVKQGYAMLSLKAIQNINYFLLKGLMYTDAVFLAKLPDLFGKELWEQNVNNVQSIVSIYLDEIKVNLRYERVVKMIVNDLIARYKAIDIESKFAYHDYDYQLQESDQKDIEQSIYDNVGMNTWKGYSVEYQNRITNDVRNLYQDFFYSQKRDFYRLTRVSDILKDCLSRLYSDCDVAFLDKLYHPSQISIFPSAKCLEGDDYLTLPTPVIGGIKNPVVMRTLQVLRRKVESLLRNHQIDPEDTKVVIETARDFNDSNMRWAIKEYQKVQENKNNEIAKLLIPFFNKDVVISEDDVHKGKLLMEQVSETSYENQNEKKEKNEIFYLKYSKQVIEKYKLWKEQNFVCMYTGRPIGMSSLLNGDKFDFEHTIPRSISFDDSQANLTICDSHYNRAIKRNRYPSQLENYEKDVTIDGITYTAIKPRLESWKKKIEHLKENIKYWRAQSSKATTKDRKDSCIRQKHLWQFELDYWQNKLDRFTCTEVTLGFKHRQLNDTRIATKYAVAYLKSAFPKVEVQKGQVTAIFRKILGIQQPDEKKSRANHYHHAIDAAVLSLIPTDALRDKLIKNYYLKEECKGLEKEHYINEINGDLRSIGLSSKCDGICDFIKDNIFVIHQKRNNSNRPIIKKIRRRGKIVYFPDDKGNMLCRYSTGDSIRGAIHKETYYGAIRPDNSGEVRYVTRKVLKYKTNQSDSGFSNWEDLEKNIVNKEMVEMMKSQFPQKTSFKDACLQGIYMLNAKGERVNRIRHIRCYTSVKSAVKIKKHLYTSKLDYKQYLYVQTADLYAMCKYKGSGRNEFIIYSLFEIVENRKNGLEDIPSVVIDKRNKNNQLYLDQIIKSGDMFLLYQNDVEELYDLDRSDLSRRLYVVKGFENPSLINLTQHSNAVAEGRGENIKTFENLPPKIRCSINTLHYLLYGKDFTIENGQINFNL